MKKYAVEHELRIMRKILVSTPMNAPTIPYLKKRIEELEDKLAELQKEEDETPNSWISIEDIETFDN